MLTQLTATAGYTTMSAAELRRTVIAMGIEGWCKSTRLLTVDANPKVAKNAKVGDYTAVMHLAPASLSGRNVCPWASKGCIAACLHTAGNPAYLEVKTRARIARTNLFFDARRLFIALLFHEMYAHINKARKLDLKPSFRLNGTSDIPWETMMHMECVAATFYDYTKSPERAIAQPYHLTFSRSESNDDACRTVLEAGGTVAVVVEGFGISAHPKPLPKLSAMFGATYPVIDGDTHDARYVDASGSIVALRAKGDAIGDTSGFVVSFNSFLS
jgi:hypothetical protein